MAKTSISDARQLYVDLAAHAITVGAYVFVSEDDERQYHFRERQLEITSDCIVDDVVLDMDDTSNSERGHLLIHVPSPWHAAISLYNENRPWLSGGYGGLRQPLIFRGQSDSRWSITTSFERRSELTSEFKQSWIYTFVDLVERVLNTPQHHLTEFPFAGDLGALYDPVSTGGPGGKAHHVATAQHFGIPTPFLDFTTDPSVAVWFASKDADTIRAPLASAFAVTVLFLGTQAALLYPHPYVGRFYRQRGMVVAVGGKGIRNLSVEVRFPPDPAFKVRRHRHALKLLQHEQVPEDWDRDWRHALWPQKPKQFEVEDEVDLLPEDPWWVQLTNVARDLVEHDRLDDLKKANWMNLHEFIGDLAISAQFMRVDHKSFLVKQAAIDLLEMLLTLTSELQGTKARVSSKLISFCVSAHGSGIRAMLPVIREVLEACPEESPLYLASTPMLEALDRSLRDPRLQE